MTSRSLHRPPLLSGSSSNIPENKPIPYNPRCTTDEYLKAIAYHSQQSSAETLYPGEIYDTLKRFLEQKSSTESNTADHASTDFAWLVSPSQPGQQPLSDKHSMLDGNKDRGRFEGFTDPQSCIEALRSNIELLHPQVLFLRGHPSPSLAFKHWCFLLRGSRAIPLVSQVSCRTRE